VKGNVVQFVFILLSLVVGAALEDVLPAIGPVGFPILLGMSLFFATTTRSPVWILSAVSAGALEEAIASLPLATAIVFFAAAALAARFFREPVLWAAVLYPAYQVWLGIITGGSGAFGRVIVSVPAGAVVMVLLYAALSRIWRKAGADA